MPPLLLTRPAFRAGVLARDAGCCVLCGAPAEEAHHILDRALWPDGGYYLDNGASVCATHHLDCEMTLVTPEALREHCGIKTALVPPQLSAGQAYDKWGNPVFADGRRGKGEMFHLPNVQAMLRAGRVLDLFVHRFRYPRTFHLPWSAGLSSDDKMLRDVSGFVGRRVIATRKMDGENTTLYRDGLHARSPDSRHHPSRDWVKALHGRIAHEIPDDWRICGENLYARHSIAYDDLPGYFLAFSIWNADNVCLSWDESLEWFTLLGLPAVEVLYDGPYDEPLLRRLAGELNPDTEEGYVLRVADAIPYGQFSRLAGKYVRASHVQTGTHWMFDTIVRNGLRTS